jgi:hypothetical protein
MVVGTSQVPAVSVIVGNFLRWGAQPQGILASPSTGKYYKLCSVVLTSSHSIVMPYVKIMSTSRNIYTHILGMFICSSRISSAVDGQDRKSHLTYARYGDCKTWKLSFWTWRISEVCIFISYEWWRILLECTSTPTESKRMKMICFCMVDFCGTVYLALKQTEFHDHLETKCMFVVIKILDNISAHIYYYWSFSNYI